MDSEFIYILQKLIAEQGRVALLDPVKGKAFLSDYTKGEYKKERHLLLQTIEAGVAKVIDTTKELDSCKKQQIRILCEERFLSQEAAANVVDTLALVLRGDTSVSLQTLQEVAKQSNPNTPELDEAIAYYEAKNYEKAVPLLEALAKQGFAEAQNKLGLCYVKGEGVAQDNAKAFEWYHKAAVQGHAIAQCNLGGRYDDGEGVARDYFKAFEWYHKAAIQGHARAQYNLGCCYNTGEGVAQDKAKAVEWFRKAADQGHAKAQSNLGICYSKGEGVEQDKAKAIEWFRKAVDQGNASAQYALGWCYSKGEGVEQDKAKAVEWYRKAADQGHAEAQDVLARLKKEGKI